VVTPLDPPFGSDDVHLIHCLIPNCTRLFTSTDPSIDVTSLGALPTIRSHTTNSEWWNSRNRWNAQCLSCEIVTPGSIIEADLPFTDTTGGEQRRWKLVRAGLADEHFMEKLYESSDTDYLTEDDERFLSQEKIPYAIEGCSRCFARDDPVVNITRKGVIPPLAPATDDREGKYCVLEDASEKPKDWNGLMYP
jgi:hypothetical protein